MSANLPSAIALICEENRLQKLLGPFASEQELLMNATRTPLYR